MKQVINGETIYSVYSLDGTLRYRDNVTTGEATDYVRLGSSGPVVVRVGFVGGSITSRDYMLQDHLGSSSARVDSSGTVTWRESYTPFGETLNNPAGNADNPGFTGHIRDTATGLTYAQARYYDPAIGRFLSNDPVGFASGGPGYFNRYAYTGNDPVNGVDPNGEWWWLLRAAAWAVKQGRNFQRSYREELRRSSPPIVLPDEADDGDAESEGDAGESEATVEGLIDDSQPGDRTRGPTRNYERPGGMDQANEDFDDLVDPESVKERGDGLRTGETRDGRPINVRPNSTYGGRDTPTVEIQNEDGTRDKFRYPREQ